MDKTERKITKIAREAEKLVTMLLREDGVGTAEIDLNPRAAPSPGLHTGKARGAAARR